MIDELFRMVTASYICPYTDCNDCKDMYRVERCPREKEFTDRQIMSFIENINLKLMDLNDPPFDVTVTEDDLVNIIVEEGRKPLYQFKDSE